MKYSNPNNTSKSILHQFSKDKNCRHYIDGKEWNNIDMSFREMKTNSDKRKFGFVIRYGNPEDKEWQLNQFDMDEDEIKQFLDIVYETVYNLPIFKDDFSEDLSLSYKDIKQIYSLITGVQLLDNERLQINYKIKGNNFNREIVDLQFDFLIKKHGIEDGLERFCSLYKISYIPELIEKIFEQQIKIQGKFIAHYLKYMSLKQFQ